LAQVLSWLPVDTETLIVANGLFSLVSEPNEESPFLVKVQSFTCGLATVIQDGLLQKQLEGVQVLIGVDAGRRFSWPKGLGMMPYEGCQIMIVDEAGDAALQAAVDNCVRMAPRSFQIGQTTVAAFVEKLENDEVSLFIAKPQRSVLVCATNRTFLDQVLARMQQAQQDRALPDSLPEWQHVDAAADVWAIRHFRRDSAENDPSSPLGGPKATLHVDPNAIGFVFWYSTKGDNVATAKCRYLTGAIDAAKLVVRDWPRPSDGLGPIVDEIKPGVVEVTCPIANNGEVGHVFYLVLMWYLGHGVVF
jgi:hypothetical protein